MEKQSQNILFLIAIIVIVLVVSGGAYLYFMSNRSLAPTTEVIVSTSTAPTSTATTTVNLPVNGDLVLGVGQTGKIGDLKITFNRFVQDSRCPIDVQCIEAGAVNVNVTLADSITYLTRNLASDEVPYVFGRYKISIVNIAPPRQSQIEIPPNSYVITFHVTSI